ncbi:hypothetical protein [Acuticoccus sp.]|uniref:hypothetical protein n=1 Tax=Acuticoccus sp. TaxID=1904378 RepID=UPI003B5245D5
MTTAPVTEGTLARLVPDVTHVRACPAATQLLRAFCDDDGADLKRAERGAATLAA